jgi:hypothetical protein
VSSLYGGRQRRLGRARHRVLGVDVRRRRRAEPPERFAERRAVLQRASHLRPVQLVRGEGRDVSA